VPAGGLPSNDGGGEFSVDARASASRPATTVLTAMRGRRTVGWASVAQAGGAGPLQGWWMWRVYVRVPYRGQGIAERLVEEACAFVAAEGGENLSLLVEPGNRPAMALYEKLGFVVFETPAIRERTAEERVRYGVARCALQRVTRSGIRRPTG
jgi:ribosomal protein S18 acetylase RimI-like enzyme